MFPPAEDLFIQRTYSRSLVYVAYITILIAVAQAKRNCRLTMSILKKRNQQNKWTIGPNQIKYKFISSCTITHFLPFLILQNLISLFLFVFARLSLQGLYFRSVAMLIHLVPQLHKGPY